MGKPYFYPARKGRANTFRRPYPEDVQKKIGQRELKISLGHGAWAELEPKYIAALVEWQHRVAEARAGHKLRRVDVPIWPARRQYVRPPDVLSRSELQGIAARWFVQSQLREPPTFTSAAEADEYVANVSAERAALETDDADARRTAAHLLNDAGYDAQAGHPRLEELAALIHRGQCASLEYAASIARGKLKDPISDPIFAGVWRREVHDPRGADPAGHRRFGELVDLYLRSRRTASVAPATKADEQRHANILLEIIGRDRKLNEVTYEVCLSAKELLLLLPANRKARYRDAPITDVPALAERDGIPPMTPKNANKYLTLLSAIFEHGKAESVGWVNSNPAKAVVLQIPKSAGQKYKVLSVEDLNAIFAAPLFRGCKDAQAGYGTPGDHVPIDSGRFWLPLIALFTGMRLNEIAQLEVADVETVEGIPVIHIREDGSVKKALKNQTATRTLPIHPELVRLGFLKFVSRQKGKKSTKLFPDLPIGKKGTAVDPFQKWWGRFLTDVGVKKGPRDGKSFHSFRHTVRQSLREAKIDREVVAALGGWKLRSDDMVGHYGGAFELRRLMEDISKIKYPGLSLPSDAGE